MKTTISRGWTYYEGTTSRGPFCIGQTGVGQCTFTETTQKAETAALSRRVAGCALCMGETGAVQDGGGCAYCGYKMTLCEIEVFQYGV